ncbi:MAG: CPBP family intramembrane metalloprotease, partial [Lachnospiraceae bacterium]|nr:CPBP family intramembrane metalloprotease [Lachnospiraceae bacterium]
GIYAFLFGLFMGYLIKRTGLVISCISFHLMFNLTGLLLDDLVPYVPGTAIRLIILAISLTGFVFTMMTLVKSEKTGQDRA